MPHIEEALVTKLESRIAKLRDRHLTLAARIIIANSLLMGCIWFMLTVWAGKRKVLLQLQGIVYRFVWGGRSQVNRATTALPRDEGGLNLLGIEAQYTALAGNFLLWVLGDDPHPLRSILLTPHWRGFLAKMGKQRLDLDCL